MGVNLITVGRQGLSVHFVIDVVPVADPFRARGRRPISEANDLKFVKDEVGAGSSDGCASREYASQASAVVHIEFGTGDADPKQWHDHVSPSVAPPRPLRR